MRPLARFGITCLIFGIGSAVLNLMNYHFTILMWADGMQPWFGLGLGLVGVGLVLSDNLGKQESIQPAQPDPFRARFAPQRGAEQQFGQQQFPQQQFAQQPAQQLPRP
ncbi:MAG: hypothetical protein M3Z00_08980 [Actinomycetota bacterium]|nr:hypothetical protein [Actinomycetota bacterium]